MALDADERAKIDRIESGVTGLTSEFREFKRSADQAHKVAYQNKSRLDKHAGRLEETDRQQARFARTISIVIAGMAVAITLLGVGVSAGWI